MPSDKACQFNIRDLISLGITILMGLSGLAFIAAALLISTSNLIEFDILRFISLVSAGIISIIIASVSKFRRFKGFGIEAELWDSKQEEAAYMIESFKNMMEASYSQILMSKVKEGTYDPTHRWKGIREIRSQFESSLQSVGIGHPLSSISNEFDNHIIWNLSNKVVRLIFKSIDIARKENSNSLDYSKFPKYNDQINLLREAEKRQAADTLRQEWARIKLEAAPHNINFKNEILIESYIDKIEILENSSPIVLDSALVALLDSELP